MKYSNLLIVRTKQMHDHDASSDSTPETVTVSSGSWTKLKQCTWTKPILFCYCNDNQPKQNAEYSERARKINCIKDNPGPVQPCQFHFLVRKRSTRRTRAESAIIVLFYVSQFYFSLIFHFKRSFPSFLRTRVPQPTLNVFLLPSLSNSVGLSAEQLDLAYF